jgi:hypothetical protein
VAGCEPALRTTTTRGGAQAEALKLQVLQRRRAHKSCPAALSRHHPQRRRLHYAVGAQGGPGMQRSQPLDGRGSVEPSRHGQYN